MSLYFDLDETTRAICMAAIGENGEHTNIDEYEYLDEFIYNKIVEPNPEIYAIAPRTYVCDAINDFLGHVTFLTAQKEKYQPYTIRWIEKNITIPKASIQHVSLAKHKLKHLHPGDLLFDDYPYFDSYDQVVVVDRPWNRHIKSKYRVHNYDDVAKILKEEDGKH
jgi:hypothetical protein